MPKLFMVRHGETDWNRQRKLQGHTDIPLNQDGIRQAQGLIARFQTGPADRVFSSDLRRAFETARIALGRASLPTDPRLREIFLGEAEGRTREEIRQIFGEDLWESWSDLQFPSYRTRLPGGESRREGVERLLGLLNEKTADLPPDGSLIFFTHGLLLRSFAQWAAHLEEPRYTTPNCCVYEWDFDFAAPWTFESDAASKPRLWGVHLLPEDALVL